MKSLKSILILTVSALLLSACQIPSLQKTVVGSERVTSEERRVGAIEQVEMGSFGVLRVSQGDQETLTVEAEDNLIPNFVTEMRGRTLVIRQKPLFSFKPHHPILFHLTVRSLESIKLSGFARAEINGLTTSDFDVKLSGFSALELKNLQATSFKARIDGFSKLSVDGQVERVAVDARENAEYDNHQLVVR
jgi:hypothetical protein